MEIVPYRRICGVYYLYQNKKLIYIGKSINVHSRVYQHTDKEFDEYGIEPCSLEELLDKETEAIYKHNPPLNCESKILRSLCKAKKKKESTLPEKTIEEEPKYNERFVQFWLKAGGIR